LTKAGPGTLTLTGTNGYSGGTTIAAGTLQVGNGGTTGTITGNVVNNGVLAFNRSTDLSFDGIISGTGSLTKAGAGTLTLSGSNSYTGPTTINGGMLSISSLADGGQNSGIGASSNDAANLVLNGGTLKFTGGG
jgi:autotransporter-associated beta strand protein